MKFSEQTEKGVSAIRPILEREIWVDNVKVIACVLVVLGHFFQSMVKASIISDNSLYQWFIQTIYYFHVPLFFICSGYLYRRGSKSHWANVLNKLIVLGVPYFTFSFATWALKTTFSGQVNTEIGGLRDVLFFHPTSPYWFLYTLFFVFLITPRFKNFKIYIVVFFASVIAKLAAPKLGIDIYAVNSVLENEVWFVGGMLLNMCDPITKLQTNAKKVTGGGYILLVLFIASSIAVFKYEIETNILSFILGVTACVAVIAIVMGSFVDNEQNAVAGFFAKYTMPIFLMHTLFAAPVRIVLMKLGLSNFLIQIAAGIAVSIIGPVIAAVIMEKTKYLEFFVYPGKFVNMSKLK